jgi:hypothetical protein
VRFAFTTAVVLVGALCLGSTLQLLWESHWFGPTRDFWRELPFLENAIARGNPFENLFERLAFHLDVLPKLLFWVEYRLFEGRNVFLKLLALLLRALSAALLIRMTAREAARLPWPTAPFLSGMVVLAMFTAAQIEVFARPFQIGLVLVAVGMLCAALAVVRARSALSAPTRDIAAGAWLGLSLLAVAAASLSATSGLAMLPTLFLTCVFLRFPPRWIFALAAASALFVAAHLIGFPASQLSHVAGATADPLGILAWLLHFLGMPLSSVHAGSGVALGSAALIALAYFWLRFWRTGATTGSLHVVHLAMSMASVAAGLMIALRRSGTEHVTWDESRYEMFVMMFWLSLISLAVLRFDGDSRLHRRARAGIVLASACWIAAVVAPEHLRRGRESVDLAIRIRAAHDAIASGVEDPRAYRATLSPILAEVSAPDPVPRFAPFLRERGLGIFAGSRVARLGQRIGAELHQVPPDTCAGTITGGRRFENRTAFQGAARYGTIEVGRGRRLDSIVIADEGGVVVGLGNRTRLAALGISAGRAPAASAEWIAFIGPAGAEKLLRTWAILGDRSVCPVGAAFRP